MPRQPMPPSERAKIFVPFDPLKGFREALAERERESRRVPERELTEEDARELSEGLARLRRGQLVSVTYYDDGRYLVREGCVGAVLLAERQLVVVGERIPLDSVRAIEVLDPSR